VAAAEEGIPDQLLVIGSDDTGAARLQLIRRLEEQRDMTPQAAAWTVDAWAAAMEVPLRQSEPIVTVPPTAPGPGPDGGRGSGGMETIPQDRSRDNLPPPPQRPWWVAALAGAILLGVAVVALIFLLRPADGGTGDASITPTASPSAEASFASEAPSEEPSAAPSSEEPTPTPSADGLTAQERELLSWIPGEVQDSCEPTSHTDYGNPRAQLECHVPGLVSTAYLMYRTDRQMRQQYDRIVQTPKNTGRCSEGRLPSETTWTSASDDVIRGRISCFRDSGDLWVVWTAEYANLLMWGYRTDGNHEKLFEAWADRAGPLLP
jgi:hypothetical protein